MKNLFNQPVTRRGEILGCFHCPLDGAKGTRKIKGLSRIKGRRAMMWGAWPGKVDNEKGLELSGSSGKLLWDALSEVGLTRDHFDVQNAGLRCWPSDNGQERDPTKRELQCCSVYNSDALDLNRGEAVVHVVLGDLAGEQLLGKALKKDQPVFWHEPWNAYVVYLQHPSYLLRRGEAAGWEFNVWKEKLRAVAAILENPGRWGYVKSRRYEAVESVEAFDAMEKIIRAEAMAGRRVSYDVEDGMVGGEKVMLLAGFGVGKFRVSGNWWITVASVSSTRAARPETWGWPSSTTGPVRGWILSWSEDNMYQFTHYEDIVPMRREETERPVVSEKGRRRRLGDYLDETIGNALGTPEGRVVLAQVMMQPLKVQLTHADCEASHCVIKT